MSIHTQETPDFTRHVGTCGDKRVAIIIQDPNVTNEVHVVDTDSLPDQYHQGLMTMLMSREAQSSKWFGEYMHRQMLFDGTNALKTFYEKGWIQQVPVTSVFLTPRPNQRVSMSEALGLGSSVVTETVNANQYNPLNDDPLANQQNPAGVQDQQFNDIVAQEQARLDAFDPAQQQNQHQVNLAGDASETNRQIAAGLIAEAKMLEADANAKRAKAAQYDASTLTVAAPPSIEPVSDGFNPLSKTNVSVTENVAAHVDSVTGKEYKTEGALKAAITRREKSAGNG